MISEKNMIVISGELISGFEFSHIVNMEKFYSGTLKVRRESGAFDFVPLIVSEALFDMKNPHFGERLKIKGQFRSYNKCIEGKNKLILFVFAFDIEPCAENENDNEIVLDGYICKETTYRGTPLGREISDIFIAVNRAHKKSDYIPCIAWGRNARYAARLSSGTRIKIHGRIQSREYKKKMGDEYEIRTAYEVSISKMEVLENENHD